MPSLTQCRDAAIALLREALPEVKRVLPFAGELDLPGLSQKGPQQGDSLFVAVLGGVNVGQSLDFDMQAAFVCLCLCRNPQREEREARALRLAEAVAALLHGASFGLPGLSPARVAEISPVPDEDVESSGVTVWAVGFGHNMQFSI